MKNIHPIYSNQIKLNHSYIYIYIYIYMKIVPNINNIYLILFYLTKFFRS
ncbi:MAG: hypothetical protein N7Q72_03665 [Spiroplasma sp. Tabriz.8]|nr:hypothetical protein [Spiroplasma sp. Tabriz.8]